MRVRDLMVTKNLLVVKEEDRLALAAQMMTWGRLRHVPVVRAGGVVGVVSERDILARRGDGGGPGWEDVPVRAVMSQPAEVTTPDEEVSQAAARMTAKRIGSLPVVEHGRLVGIITSTDIVGSVVSDMFAERAAVGRPVREAMQEEVFSVRTEDDLMEAVDLMAARRVRHLPVVGEGGRVVGILSDRDVRAAIGDPTRALDSWLQRAGGLRVSAVMSTSVVTIRPQALLGEALRLLLGRRVGALPVVDDQGRLSGILSYLDVLRALRRS